MEQQMMDRNEQRLWEVAKKRASFKSHVVSYLIVNAFLWGLWYFSGEVSPNGFPWPVWSMLGWGIGLVFHYMGAYVWPSGGDSVEREFRKLKQQQQ